MKRSTSIVLLTGIVLACTSIHPNSLYAQTSRSIFSDSPRDREIINDEPSAPAAPTVSTTSVKKNNSKADIFADCRRELRGIQGVEKIERDKTVVPHRQASFRFSEKNKAGNWIKIEVIGADYQPKEGLGLQLLHPTGDDMQKWADCARLEDICCIRFDYESSGEKINKEIATDKNGRVIYIGTYTYQDYSPKQGNAIITVSYNQQNGTALFNYKQTRMYIIRYYYNDFKLNKYELIDAAGQPADAMRTVIDDKTLGNTYRDRNYRPDSIVYNDTIACRRDSIHKKTYKYDDKGNIIWQLNTRVNGDTCYLFELTSTYRRVQNADGIISIDSLDNHGNTTWAARFRDSLLIQESAGHNIRYTEYNYFDSREYPESFLSVSRFASIKPNDKPSEQTLYILKEEVNYRDSIYSARIYNQDGNFAGGFAVNGLPYQQTAQWSPKDYDSIMQHCRHNYRFAYISESGSQLANLTQTEKANAMIISITGERARRLGLQDNDIIATWNEWAYCNGSDSTPDLNRLWLYSIITQKSEKQITVLRRTGDSLHRVKVALPKGNLSELQFLLLPATVSESMLPHLRQFVSNMQLKQKIVMAIPKNPLLHQPAVLFAGVHHPSEYYTDKRPEPKFEWSYKDHNREYSSPNQNEKLTAWITTDLYSVECKTGVQEDYDLIEFKVNEGNEYNNALKVYDVWKRAVYESLKQDPIDLPLLQLLSEDKSSKKDGFTPAKVMERTICDGNPRGKELWKEKKTISGFEYILKESKKHKKSDSQKEQPQYKKNWEDWYKSYILGSGRAYIIPLNYRDGKQNVETQTLEFVKNIQKLKLSGGKNEDAWVLYKKGSKDDYYILISYDPQNGSSKSKAQKGIAGKGSKVFIYDRNNRIAAYIEK